MREFAQIPQCQLNELRSFCAHELAVRLDIRGGLCDMSYIDTVEREGVLYPDERPILIFSRDHAELVERPLYGPAVQVLTRTQKGRTILHHPETHTFSPWSLFGEDEEQSYHFFMERNRIFWRMSCAAEDKEEICWCLQRAALFCGEKQVHFEQHTGVSSTQSGGLYTKEEQEKNQAVLNGTAKVQWRVECFDTAQQVLYIRGTVAYPFGEKIFYLAVGCNAPITCRETSDVTNLCASWNAFREITFVMALGENREEAFAAMRDGTENYPQIYKHNVGKAESVEADALVIKTAQLDVAEEFSQMAAQYLNAMTVGQTDQGDIGIRAAVYKYGYFSLWDAIYPVRDLLWNNRLVDAQRQITYLLSLPMMENTPIAGLHAIVQFNEVLAFCPEWNTDHLYPAMVKIFRLAARATEPVYRMLVYHANVGVDRPEELGVTGAFLSPEINALWYMACRIIRNEAMSRDDMDTGKDAEKIIRSIEAGYRTVFFDEAEGYLRSAVFPDLTLPQNPIFQNTNTWGYDYPFGMYLMRDMVKPLAQYQANCLYHPEGHRSVAVDSLIPCEMWKQAHMNQHNGHEMKLQRMAGQMDEVYRIMTQYLKRFARWQVAEETTNFSRYAIHPSQVCDWQAFSATANMEALRSAVAGIFRHRGGIGYLPAADCGEMQIRNIPTPDGKISVTVEGVGRYGLLIADGCEIPGTLQVPLDISYTTLTIQRTDKLPEYPVLMAALDMPIEQVAVTDNALRFVCGNTAMTPICFLCEAMPAVFVNDVELPVQYNADNKHAWVDYCWRKGDIITVQL